MEPRVRLLGPPRVWDGGVWRSALVHKRFALLAYLACAEDWVARERLSFLFWPDTPDEQARVNLRQLLIRTRALPYAERLEADWKRVRWPVVSDVSEFRRALRAQDRPTAIGWYQGDLLAGFEAVDMSEYGYGSSSNARNCAKPTGEKRCGSPQMRVPTNVPTRLSACSSDC